jgi:chaperone required for assembly of F1-ATPase
MSYKAEAPSKVSDSLGYRPKRFWTTVAAFDLGDGFEVRLDNRPVRTPQGEVMTLPNAVLAEAVATEWARVGEHVDYAHMPLTRLAFAAIDRMDDKLEESRAEALRYAETDLTCYPSDYPQALIAREAAAWSPVLAWAEAELGLRFHQNKTLIHKPQPTETLAKISALLTVMTRYERAGLMAAIPLLGSVVLALGLWRGYLTGAAAFAASRIGEDFQAEQWGRDAEAEQRAEGLRRQAVSLETWFRALA